MTNDIVTYIKNELNKQQLTYPWKMSVHKEIQSIYLFFYLPIGEDKKYQVIFHLDGLSDQVTTMSKKIIVPLFNVTKGAEEGYLNLVLLGIHKTLQDVALQIEEVDNQRRVEVIPTWPNEELIQIKDTRSSINRYNTKKLHWEA